MAHKLTRKKLIVMPADEVPFGDLLADFARKWAPLASKQKQELLMSDVMKIASRFCWDFVKKKMSE